MAASQETLEEVRVGNGRAEGDWIPIAMAARRKGVGLTTVYRWVRERRVAVIGHRPMLVNIAQIDAQPRRRRRSRLREARIAAGLDQRELAVLAGVQRSVLSRIESGKGLASRETRERVAAVLGCEPGDLFLIPRCRRCQAELDNLSAEPLCLDCAHPLRRLRRQAGISLEALAPLVGCNFSTLARIERGEFVPSYALAERLAAAVGCSVEDVFGTPRSCGCGCGLPTYRRYREGHFAPRSPQVGHVQRFRRYLAENGLVDAGTLADRVGCSRAAVKKHAARGTLPAKRYRGPWQGPRPWMFHAEEAEPALRALFAKGRETRNTATSERLRGKWARGEMPTKPRLGQSLACPCGCGGEFYRPPSALERYPRHYYSSSCVTRHRWQHRDEAWSKVEGAIRGAWPAKARQRELGRLYGHRGAAAGIEAGRALGGRRPICSPAQQQQMLALHKQGHSTRAIAELVFGDARYKDRVARFLRR